MPDDKPHFDDAGRLIAPKYDDVYFSAEDGLAETRHVFLEGNHLAERFTAMKPGEVFTIGETGFGTGLNFLAAWQLFEQHAPADARLEFVSVEGWPLDAETMRRALSPWPELSKYREELLQQWGSIWPGLHRFIFSNGRVHLSLLVGEASRVLSAVDASVRAWFLDGFAPSRNPDMWSEAVLQEVARLSAGDASIATYSAAGGVRRGLESVGFQVIKCSGFGSKRDMTVGRVTRGEPSAESPPSCEAVVIGASLAGSFAARALAERGVVVTVLEQEQMIDGELQQLKPRVAVLQPKINHADDWPGRLLREGYASAYRRIESDSVLAERAAWQRCGTFQAAVDHKLAKKLNRFVNQFRSTGLCRWVEQAQTEADLGLQLPVGGVVIDAAGILRPAGLCAAMLDHPSISVLDRRHAVAVERMESGWQVRLDGLEVVSGDAVVIANSVDAKSITPWSSRSMHPVRGQVTMLRRSEAGVLGNLKRALFYGGYLTPAINGVQMLGATFVPDDTDTEWRREEHDDVCDQLARLFPDEAARLRGELESEGWVGLRAMPPRHEAASDWANPGLYYSIQHGSHGISSAATVAEQIACLVTGGVRRRAYGRLSEPVYAQLL